jgi:hypothetical protein
MRIKNYINGVEGVIAGGVATVNVPINRRYHSLKAFVSATVSGSPSSDPTVILEYVRLIVNGVVMRDLTPQQYIRIAQMNGNTVGTGEVPFYFSEPWRASVIGEESTSWDMFGQTKFTLEFKFLPTAINPTLAVIGAYDFARNVSDGKPFLAIVKQLRQTYNAPSGRYDVTTLPVRFPIQRILLSVSTGTVADVEVYRDNEKVHEGTAAENARFLADYGLDGTDFSYPVVFDYEQQISSPLIVDKELNVRVNSSTANTLTAIVEHRANGYV